MNYEQVNKNKNQAVEWVQSPNGAKAFADTVVTSAFVMYGSVSDGSVDDKSEARESMESCGKMLAMVHPQAVFHACCEHAHGGTNACIRAMIENGEIEGEPDGADALRALSHACDLMCKVVETTEYYNYENVCKALRALPEALDKQRIQDEAFGSKSDGSWVGFNPMTGTIEIADGDEDPNGEGRTI